MLWSPCQASTQIVDASVGRDVIGDSLAGSSVRDPAVLSGSKGGLNLVI
jgi:hypothetical protein